MTGLFKMLARVEICDSWNGGERCPGILVVGGADERGRVDPGRRMR